MGHITSTLEAENDLTVVTVVGEVDEKQLLNQITSFLTGKPTQLVLWDLREGSLAKITGKDLRMIAQQGAKFADSRRGGRTAIVCSRDLEYGFSRMFQTLAELYHVPFDINVFRNAEEAREWLNEDRKVKSSDAV